MDTNTPPRQADEPALLVTRDADALEEIDARMVARVKVQIFTPHVGRLLRREYNWMARKMFLRGRSDEKFRKQTIRLIDEIAAEITMLEADIEHLDRWPERELTGHELEVRVVDIASARLLVQWRRLDGVAAILYRAQIFGMVLTTEDRWEYLQPVIRATSRLTNHCLGVVDADVVARSAAALRLSD